MFPALSAHLQEDTVVYMQHMVLSLSMRVRVGLSLVESDSTICCMYTILSSWRWALKARNMYKNIIFY